MVGHAAALELASFDVFDTVLTRAVGPPAAVFTLLARELRNAEIIECSVAEFVAARRQADRATYERLGRDGAVNLPLIAAELGRALELDSSTVDVIAKKEMALEARLLQPVPAGAEAVARARRRGLGVRYLSDMYLSHDFIQQQLQRHGLWQPGDRLLVSGEARASKRSGRLYERFAAQEQTAPARIGHLGNDLRADVRMARRAGLSASHLPEGNLTDAETRLASLDNGLTTALAGAARLARLRTPAPGPVSAARRDVTADVLGPLLIGYVLWILHRAAELGLERLYFLSRDGQVLLDIARQLQPSLRYDVASIELRYLYASREAWNVAALRRPEAQEMSWVLSHSQEGTLQSLVRRLGLSLDDVEVRAALRSVGLDPRSGTGRVGAEQRALLYDAVSQAPLVDLIARAAAGQRELVGEYLRQEQVMDAPCGFVDVVARGTQHRAAVEVCRDAGGTIPHGFFLGIQADPTTPPSAAERMHAWLYDDNAGRGLQRHGAIDVLAMAACAADEGTLTGYRRTDGVIEPVLRSHENDRAIDWGLPLVRETLRQFCGALMLEQPWVDAEEDIREQVVAGVRDLWDRPSPRQADAWGTFPYEHGSGHEPRWRQIAPVPTVATVMDELQGREEASWVNWRQGQIARANPVTRTLLRLLHDGRAAVSARRS